MTVHEHDIDALYTAPLADFIDARKALAGRVKKEGDKEGAARIGALAKPSVAAWTVNQLYRGAKGKLETLLEAGASLREAHRQGASGVRAVFAAQQAQRAAVDALTHAARSILEKAGLPATEATLTRVGETLVSISTLNRWGDGKPGQLTKELTPPGFDALLEVLGSSDHEAPRAKVETPKAEASKPSPERAKASHAALEARRKAAMEARRKAEANVAEATRNKSHAEARAKEMQLAAGETQNAANAAETKARKLADAVKAAEAALAEAKRAASEAAKEASASADRAEEARAAADKARRASAGAAEELARAESHLAAARRAESDR